MTLLVLDTATDRCALALARTDHENGRHERANGSNNLIAENTRSIPRAHNEYLLPMLDELFVSAKLSPRDLAAIGFAAGPGSFTGIRISAAAAQALAVTAGAQVLPISSSRLLAAAALRQLTVENLTAAGLHGVQTVLRSRRNYVYVAEYSLSAAAVEEGGDYAEELKLELEADDLLLGDQELVDCPVPVGLLRIMEGSSGDNETTTFGATAIEVAITDLITLATADFAAGLGLPPEAAQPRYVEGDTPWQPRASSD